MFHPHQRRINNKKQVQRTKPRLLSNNPKLILTMKTNQSNWFNKSRKAASMQQNQPPQIKMSSNQPKRNQPNKKVMRNQMMSQPHQRKLLPQLSQLLNQLLKKLQLNQNQNQMMRILMMSHPPKNKLSPQSQLLNQLLRQLKTLMMIQMMSHHPPKRMLFQLKQLQ
jgi:hypothetical protein